MNAKEAGVPANAPGSILTRADELRASGCDPRQAFDRALEEYEALGPHTRATVDALVEILERAAALHEQGSVPDDAMAQALDQLGANDDLAAVARAAWAFDLGKGGS